MGVYALPVENYGGLMLPDNLTEPKRLFVAIDISEYVLAELLRVQSRLEQRIGSGGRLVPAMQLHLTLLFMPAVADALIPALMSSIASVTEKMAPVSMALSEVGTFPHSAAARIVWVGVETARHRVSELGGAGVCELQRALADAVAPVGVVPAASRFVPHITIIRSNRRSRMCLAELPPKFFRVEKVTWLASSIKLFHSISTSTGHTHRQIACFPFQA